MTPHTSDLAAEVRIADVDGRVRLHATDTKFVREFVIRDGTVVASAPTADASADLVLRGSGAVLDGLLSGAHTMFDVMTELTIEGELWALMSLAQLLQHGLLPTEPLRRAHRDSTLVSTVRQLVAEMGLPTQGFQLFASRRGEEVNVAVGETLGPLPMTTLTRHHVRCATKPLLALAALALEAQGALDLDAPLASVAGFPQLWDATGSLRDALCHDAGLGTPRLAELWFAGARRGELLGGLRQTSPHEQYSEVAAWHLVGAAIEQRTGLTPEIAVNEVLLAPLGLDPYGFDIGGRQGVGIYFAAKGTDPPRIAPLLMDLGVNVRRQANPVRGTVASAESLGRLYCRLVDEQATLGRQLADAATSYRRGRAADPILRRSIDFCTGFMIGLRDHGYGNVSAIGPSDTPAGWAPRGRVPIPPPASCAHSCTTGSAAPRPTTRFASV